MTMNGTGKIVVAILAGGPDAEREVSLMSGRAITEALRAHNGGRTFDVRFHDIHKLTQSDVAAINCDVFFPALHGPWGEGGALQRLLETDGRPFVGSGSQAAETAMDKMKTKAVAQRVGVPTPPACILRCEGCALMVEPPLVLKPIDDGSSVDVFICRTPAEVAAARKDLHARRSRVMAERFIPGCELTVGIVGDEALPVIEIVPGKTFYDYQAKYFREDTRYVINPSLPASVEQRLKEDALRLFRALNCRDVARVDFRYDDVSDPAEPAAWMLEINTLPGFTSHSLVPMAAAATGETMPALCARLVRIALTRDGARARASA